MGHTTLTNPSQSANFCFLIFKITVRSLVIQLVVETGNKDKSVLSLKISHSLNAVEPSPPIHTSSGNRLSLY